ncbi:MAG: hypothetical protein KAT68_03275 [Bacteroidales bacterium]|nr:hypothetical protein [Bacteroidales bacterium]
MKTLNKKTYYPILPPLFNNIISVGSDNLSNKLDKIQKKQSEVSKIRNFYKLICTFINFENENFL